MGSEMCIRDRFKSEFEDYIAGRRKPVMVA